MSSCPCTPSLVRLYGFGHALDHSFCRAGKVVAPSWKSIPSEMGFSRVLLPRVHLCCFDVCCLIFLHGLVTRRLSYWPELRASHKFPKPADLHWQYALQCITGLDRERRADAGEVSVRISSPWMSLQACLSRLRRWPVFIRVSCHPLRSHAVAGMRSPTVLSSLAKVACITVVTQTRDCLGVWGGCSEGAACSLNDGLADCFCQGSS